MEVALTHLRRSRASYSLQQKVGFEPIRGRKIKFYTIEAWMCMKTQKLVTNCLQNTQTFWAIERHLSDILGLRFGKTPRIRVQNDRGAPLHAGTRERCLGDRRNGRERCPGYEETMAGSARIPRAPRKPTYNGISREVVENNGQRLDDSRH